MDRLTGHQLDSNAESRDRWDRFAAHRHRVSSVLRQAAPRAPGSLCVLGAGNCNDLDLGALLQVYRQICLVDLDPAALAHGVAQQGLADHAALRPCSPIDVTARFDTLANWTPATDLTEADLAACAELPLRDVLPALPGPFAVAASACLLTQLMNGVVTSLGERHPRFLPTLQAVRAGHLRLLAGLVAPGGTGLIVTDVVSTDSLPALSTTSEAALPALLAQAIQQRNFFHGVNPAALGAWFHTDPVVAPLVADVQWVPPWLWDFGPRTYLVYACTFRKRALTA